MSTFSEQVLLNAMSSECQNASDKLILLQSELGGLAAGKTKLEDISRELQFLDIVQQTIADLARMLGVLANCEFGTSEETVEAALRAIHQATLRERLSKMDSELEHCEEDELW